MERNYGERSQALHGLAVGVLTLLARRQMDKGVADAQIEAIKNLAVYDPVWAIR